MAEWLGRVKVTCREGPGRNASMHVPGKELPKRDSCPRLGSESQPGTVYALVGGLRIPGTTLTANIVSRGLSTCTLDYIRITS